MTLITQKPDFSDDACVTLSTGYDVMPPTGKGDNKPGIVINPSNELKVGTLPCVGGAPGG